MKTLISPALSMPALAASAAVSVILALLPAAARATDTSGGTVLVTNNHGGYNVAQSRAGDGSIGFFGKMGFASIAIAHAHDKPKFILAPVVEDVGHGAKIVVYKRIYFATAEEAEAARLKQ